MLQQGLVLVVVLLLILCEGLDDVDQLGLVLGVDLGDLSFLAGDLFSGDYLV